MRLRSYSKLRFDFFFWDAETGNADSNSENEEENEDDLLSVSKEGPCESDTKVIRAVRSEKGMEEFTITLKKEEKKTNK